MSLQNVQVEFAELLVANEQQTDLIQPSVNIIIYHNNLLSHLMRALQNTYPLIHKLVGEEAFKAACRDYIERYPSTSGNLDEYGEYFSHFLAGYSPAAELVYLPDVARFEWTCHLLSRAGDAMTFDPSDLVHLSENDYADLRFVLHPAVSIMTFSYPVTDFLKLCHGEIDAIETLSLSTYHTLLFRLQNDIQLKSLTPAEFTFLHQAQDGQTLADCLHAATQQDPSFNLDDNLQNWVKNHIIVDFTLPN